MNKKWISAKLVDVCEYIGRGISPKYTYTEGIIVLNKKCIRNHLVSYAESKIHNIVEKKINSEKYIQVGDVLINSTGTGTLGRVALVTRIPKPTVVDSHITIVRPIKNTFSKNFFGWALIYIEDLIKESGEGASGQTELSRELVKRFKITYPKEQSEQNRITAILDKAFAEIEKAKGQIGNSIISSSELFATYLQQICTKKSSNWEFHKLGEVCKFNGGSQPSKKFFSSVNQKEYIRLIQIRDYKSDKYITYIPKELAKRFCTKDDIMIGRYGPPVFQILTGLDGAYNVALMKTTPDETKLTKRYLFYFLKHRSIQQYIIRLSTRAAGQSGLNKETIEPYPISLPPLKVQENIVKKLDALSAQTNALQQIYKQKLANLEELKKSILHKAFNGEL